MKRGKKWVLVTICLLLMVVCCAGTLSAFAFTGIEPKDNLPEVLSDANTYNCVGYNAETDELTYDMSNRKNVQVSDSPLITVLTHSLGGSATDWSRNLDIPKNEVAFFYDSDSLIERLHSKCGQANIYWAKMTSKTDFDLIDLNAQPHNAVYEIKEEYKLDKITDISKHIILVFEADNARETNATTYYEFNNMISKVICDVAKCNDGILPKVNLVGYSRGGLVNLLYALDHPDLVDSLVSIGTPYFGSDAGELKNFFASDAGLRDVINEKLYSKYAIRWNTYYNTLYKNINSVAIGGYASIKFLSEALALGLQDWIQNLDTEKVISVYELLNLEDWIKESDVREGFELFKQIDAKELVDCFKYLATPVINLAVNVSYVVEKIPFIKKEIKKLIGDKASGKISNIDQFIDLLIKFINTNVYTKFKKPYAFFNNDISVGLNSALGISETTASGASTYKGFRQKTRFFNTNDGTNFNKSARKNVPVPHNLEPRDSTIISWVLDELELGKGVQGHKYSKKENSVLLSGYRGLLREQDALVPETIEDLPVDEINRYAFDAIADKNNITELVIPNTVEKIGEYAFANNKNLTKVTFESGSQLKEIGEHCFEGCENLVEIQLPSGITSIGESAFKGCGSLTSIVIPSGAQIEAGAFEDCTSLQSVTLPCDLVTLKEGVFSGCESLASITLPDSLTDVYSGAFYNCKSLTSITLPQNVDNFANDALMGCSKLQNVFTAAGNEYYQSIDGVLYGNVNKSLECYPICKTASSYTAADFCEYIQSGAFMGNTHLQSVNLKNVTDVGMYAFYDCVNLADITCDNLIVMRTRAFDNTAWLNGEIENGTEYISKGKVLIKYNGNATDLVFSGNYTSFADNAFENNKTLQTITFLNENDGTELLNIGSFTFNGCENLQRINIKCGRVLNCGEYILDLGSETEIYVVKAFEEAYKQNNMYSPYVSRIKPIATDVTFNSNGGSAADGVTLYYLTQIGYKLPEPVKNGYKFNGWAYTADDGTEKVIVDTDYDSFMSSASACTLNAQWEQLTYSILFFDNNADEDIQDLTYTVGSEITLPKPTKRGCSFDGWYTNEDFSGSSVDKINIDDFGDKAFYAKWEPKQFEITLKFGCDDFADEKVLLTYGEPASLSVISRRGYTFLGWYDENDLQYANEFGVVLQPCNITADCTLTARWTEILYSVIARGKGNKTYWLSQTGFVKEETLIAYNTPFESWQNIVNTFEYDILAGKKFAGFKYNGELVSWSRLPYFEGADDFITLNKYYEDEVFTVKFDTAGGDAVADRAFRYGEQINLPTPVKYGYGFVSWKVAENENNEAYSGTAYAAGNVFNIGAMPDLSVGVEQDRCIYLVAEYIAKEFEITFNSYGGTNVNAIKVTFGTSVTLNTPTCNGYTFKGWCFDTDGKGGVGEVCTDSDGKMLVPWNKANNCTLYASWKLTQYRISYQAMGISRNTEFTVVGGPFEYNIESPRIALPNAPIIKDYTFIGWFSDYRCTKSVSYIERGSTGNKIFFAKYKDTIHLHFFNELKVEVLTQIGCEGDTVILHDLGHKGYTTIWTGNYYGNQPYVLKNRDESFYYIGRKPNVYSVTLKNNGISAITDVTFGQTYNLGKPVKAGHIFCGWYNGAERLTDRDGVSLGTWIYANNNVVANAIFVPDRWTLSRQTTYKITDEGRFKQPYDVLTIDGKSLKYLADAGYTKLTITANLNIWEKDDGYQGIIFYDGTGTEAKAFDEWTIEHGGSKKNTSSKTYTFTVDTDNTAQDFTLCIRYGASGKFDDDWYNNNLTVTVTPVM